MTTASHRLKAVSTSDPSRTECSVVCQVTLRGQQVTSVRVLTPVSGPAERRIGIRVGAILLLISDRPALDSVSRALEEAEQLACAALDAAHD
jgi:hypothetical protein